MWIISPILKVWRGQYRLWVLFWVVGVVIQFVMGKILGVIISQLPEAAVFVAQICIPIYMVIYTIWWAVGLWRGAFNTKWKTLGYVARAFILCLPFLYGYGMWMQQQAKNPEHMQEVRCRNLIIRYKEAAKLGVPSATFIHEHVTEFKDCPKDMLVL